MPLFRRRAGRHAAHRAADPRQPAATAFAAPPAAFRAVPPATPAPPQREPVPPTGPVPQQGRVRLGFSDGSAVTLSPDDPRTRAFRALARELARRG